MRLIVLKIRNISVLYKVTIQKMTVFFQQLCKNNLSNAKSLKIKLLHRFIDVIVDNFHKIDLFTNVIFCNFTKINCCFSTLSHKIHFCKP